MATVRDLISDALFSIGALGQGDTLDDANAEMCLRRLTRMIDSWANETLFTYSPTNGTITLVAGTASYSTTTLSSGRPTTVDNLFLRLDGIDYPCERITDREYDAITYKASSGLPGVYYYDPGYANGTFYFYPTPSAAYVAHVSGREPLATALALTTTLSLPEGYEKAICDSAAVDFAPSFGRTPSRELMMAAKRARDVLKTTNYVPGIMATGLPGTGSYVPGYLRISGDT